MSVAEFLSAAKDIPFDERVKLAQRVWSNIVENGYDPELTPKQIVELERRAENLRKNPQDGIPWEQVRNEVRQRFGWK
jgi:putative addiction module component (TIGR02574 family)